MAEEPVSGERDATDVAALAETFLARVRRGEQPDIGEYAERHPHLAAQIRSIFPFMLMMEQRGAGPDDEIPERIDSYDVQAEIGRGGMGAVLEVFDSELQRELAMKVSLTGTDPRSLARFVEEARITGQLDHPGVVPVHALGVGAEGKPYFTMRLVRGEELTRTFERVRSGDEGWTQTRVVGLLQRVCEAMAFAHQKGIVHRDLKPSNVMVGGHGEVYVMDWGLARDEERHDRPGPGTAAKSNSPLETRAGTVLGTPSYMPPEQAAGRLDELGPRSDVYSVGAMLYHLLAGRAPYTEAGASAPPAEILQRVLAGPPRPLHTFDPVPVELAAICEKAMARRVDERYADMGGFADDLRAYLENRVVRAHRTGAWVEFRKWVERNRTLALSLLATLVLIVGGSASAAGILAAKNEEIRAAVDDADRSRDAAERTVDFLVDLFRAPAPENARGEVVTAKNLLDRGALQVDEELSADPLVRARLLTNMGRAYVALGEYAAAEPLLERAVTLCRDELGPDHRFTLDALTNLGDLYLAERRLAEAAPLLEGVLEQRRRSLGRGAAPTLYTMNNLALVYAGQGRLDEAERLYGDCVEALVELHGRTHAATLVALSNLADFYTNLRRYEEAEPLHVECLESRMSTLGERHPETIGSLNGLALLLTYQRRFDEAEPLHLRSVALAREVLGERHPDTLTSLMNHGVHEMLRGRYAAAEASYLESLEGRREVLVPGHPDTQLLVDDLELLYETWSGELQGPAERTLALAVLDRHAHLRETTGRLESAEAMYREVLDGRLAELGPEHADTRASFDRLVSLYAAQGRWSEAEPLARELLDLTPADDAERPRRARLLTEIREAARR